ncbi:DUF4355 domain-containing protein [Clostridium beijerinckii]|uniref:DUF4355 domain-containing protein n=1 Tax=Clostridium beijerinckii TaxID=1520 RepID=UPI00047A3055|nr:DUF4355 domain-containing protein [Clostridium beijerinckii]
MKKNEINELLKDLAEDADIDDVVKGNETLSKLFEKDLTIDDVKNFLDSNEDGKKYLQQYGDTRVTDGIKSWQKNNLQKLIDDAVSKTNPQETPEQKMIRELQEKFEQSEKQRTQETLRNKALKVATEKKLPGDLIDYLIGQDEETTLKNLDNFNDIYSKTISQAIEEKLKGGYKPPSGDPTPVDESKMTDDEWFAAHQEK